MRITIHHLFRSPGHDFYGRHGLVRLEHGIEDSASLELVAGSGIVGDRFFDYKPDYQGQVTFFEQEVYESVQEQFGLTDLEPQAFRRNIVVSGIRLNELIGKHFSINTLEFTGSCEAKPCYWMDEACAPGVEEFLRGKGGLRARIKRGGMLEKGEHELVLFSSAKSA